MTDAVRLDGLTKRFGDVVAVDDIDLRIKEGEFFSLLGPSGCGKTTTLRMISGLEVPTAGGISIFGEDMTGVSPQARPTNLVFQNLALFPHMTVGENIRFGLKHEGLSAGERDRRVDEMLSVVDLDGFGDRNVMQLSGGQQQRVALARALVKQPDVLLLDEPLGSLDRKLRQHMQFELKAIQEELNLTFVYVTHDQEVAMTMSDRMAVMRDGEVVQVGAPSAVYDRPTDAFVAEFIGDANFVEGRLSGDGSRFQHNGLTFPVEGGPAADGARLVIRPENVAIGDGAADRQFAFDGTVVGRIDQGHTVTFEVELDDGLRLTVRRKEPDIREGDATTVGFGQRDYTLVGE